MRSIWNGAIGFGLVNIPVKLYSASEDSSLDLDMLDKADYSNIRFKRINEKTGKDDRIKKLSKIHIFYTFIDDTNHIVASKVSYLVD